MLLLVVIFSTDDVVQCASAKTCSVLDSPGSFESGASAGFGIRGGAFLFIRHARATLLRTESLAFSLLWGLFASTLGASEAFVLATFRAGVERLGRRSRRRRRRQQSSRR